MQCDIPHLRLWVTGLLILILNGSSLAQDKYTISGNVRDGNTGEELIGVSVIHPATSSGTVTNVYGFYSLTLPAGKQKIIYSYIGFEADTVEFELNTNVTQNIELLTASVDVQEVVVQATRNNENITNTEIGVVKMDIKELNEVPVLFGERDILKSIQ